MKKTLFIFTIIAASLAGCTREIEPEDTKAPESDYLVIKAGCSSATKTDIVEGESFWKKNDVIEVVYKDNVYEYTVSELVNNGAGAYFSSTNGISDYDGSGIVAYYNAIDAANGIVGVESSWTIAFSEEGQVNPACAPLVGNPYGEGVKDGVLTMQFDNIFSVMELRIDPTGKPVTGQVQTLTIEPADASSFEGCLAFKGSVDPQTLALTAAQDGTANTLTIKLPEGTDLAQAQTIKFPVGRFTTSAGLKLTLALSDGSSYEKTIYKSGVTSYIENEGVWAAKHLARAMYSFIPTFFSGGDGTAENPYAIATVEDLKELSEYVASKEEDFLHFRTAHYIQIADIDFEGNTHYSIGNTNDAAPYSFFNGNYNGNGYKISNVVIANKNTDKAHGFFGYLDGEAYIRNITMENVTVNATTWNAGTIVGCAQSTSTAVIENCKVTGGSVISTNKTTGGICGKLMAGTIKGCSFEGSVSGDMDEVGGICGMQTGTIEDCAFGGNVTGKGQNNGGISGNHTGGDIKNCTVKGTVTALTSGKHQCGGIVGFTNIAGSTVEGCTFDGRVTAACGNVGGIAGALNGGSTVKGCTVTAASVIEAGTITNNGINLGGIVGYVNNSSTGGKVINNECAGTIVSHYYDAGGIVGHNRGLAIIGCRFSGTISTDYDDSGQSYGSNASSTKYSRIGGICGDIRGSGSIDNCEVTGTVDGKKWTGGIVGLLEAGGVTSCRVISATVNGTQNAGGIVGYISTGTIKSCTVNTSTISADQNVGGLVGSMVAAASITSSNIIGGTVKGTKSVGGIAGHFNKGGTISQCTIKDASVEATDKIAGGVLGYMASCTDAKTARIENCNVYGGIVTAQTNGHAGGIVAECDGQGIINKCSANCNVYNTGTGGGGIGGIVGYAKTDNLLIANCIYYGEELTNDKNTNGGVGGIVGSFAASGVTNTAIVNSVSFPTKVSTGSGNANIAGIAGYAYAPIINNCYCPTPASAFLFNGAADGASRGSLYGWMKGGGSSVLSGVIKNGYWLDTFKAGNCANHQYEKAEQSLTDAQMRNTGAVSMPSTGTAYPCFIDALNAGADEYNTAMIFDVRAEEWVMGTNGYPVIYGCPLASSDAASSKTRVSFIGDSITSYKGYTLFPSNGQYPSGNVTSVTQTYWYQLVYDRMTDAVIEANSSHTATCVQNTVKNGYPGYGFLNRYADLGNPDVIFINGGTNDSWSFKLPVGALDFNLDINDLDTYQFAQAYDKLIRLMQAKYPKAKIFCIIGDCVMDSQYTDYAQVIRDVCNHYNVKYAEVVFSDRAAMTTDNVHPNAEGMTEMADQIWNQVKNYL